MLVLTKKTLGSHLETVERCFIEAEGSVQGTIERLKAQDLSLSKTSFYRILTSAGFFERPSVAQIKSRFDALKSFLLSLDTASKTIPEIIAALEGAGFEKMNQPHLHGYLRRLGLKYKKCDPAKKVYLNLNRERRAPRGRSEISQFVAEKGWSLETIHDPLNVDLSVKGKILNLYCPQGHFKRTTLSRFFEKQNCLACSKESKRASYEQKMREHFASLGMKYNESEGQAVVAVCSKGHEFNVLFSNFKKNNACPECYFERKGFSLAEVEIVEFLKAYYQGPIDVRNRQVIPPLEVDIFLPELKIAIEYHGLYFHSFHPNRHLQDVRCKFKTEDDAKTYHRKKLDACKNKSIRLISIFEDEWLFKRNICESKIKSLLGKSERLYARDLELRELNTEETKKFMDANHLQGFRGGYTIGLVQGDIVYCAMTLSKPIRSHTAANKTIEVGRFASACGYNVVGGFSKILKKAKVWAKEKGYLILKTHCDLRWGVGAVYEKTGFRRIGETKYTPHYVKSLKRFRNQSLKKTAEERKSGKTEKQLRFEQGYSIIYDCGHSTWEIYLK